MHQQLSDPGTFSQHQPMERDDSGIVAPSNIFHQPMPNSFVDFSKVSYRELDLWNDQGLTLLHLLFCLFTVCVRASAAIAHYPRWWIFFHPRTDQKKCPSLEAGLNKARVCRLQVFSVVSSWRPSSLFSVWPLRSSVSWKSFTKLAQLLRVITSLLNVFSTNHGHNTTHLP